MIDHFDFNYFDAVVLDESSILKAISSKTRKQLTKLCKDVTFKLSCTATPAPNDHIELGNHAEFLGALTRTEMLSTYFVHDGGETQKWRLKRHAADDFWHWVCSWAVILRKPSDLGFDDDGYDLPKLNIMDRIVEADDEMAKRTGTLFVVPANTLSEQRAARRASMDARIELAAEIANAEPDEQWLLWCDLNDESTGLTEAIDGAVEVRGSDDAEVKVERLHGFRSGKYRALVTKPSIAGHGLNLQRCARVIFVGLSHSWEAWYQAIRRTWRFGQEREVDCYMISSDMEGAVAANLARKQVDAEAMITSMVEAMGEIEREEIRGMHRETVDYEPSTTMEIPEWLRSEAP